MRVKSGRADVIASGQVTAFEGQPLLIFLDDWEFAIGFRFEADGGALDVQSQLHPGRLELTLLNFDGADGRGSAEPVHLVERGDRVLWLHFRTFRYGQTLDHTVHYTIYATLRDSAPSR